VNLLLFEIMSQLKVNFHKSLLVGINICQRQLDETTNILHYKLRCVPIKYSIFQLGQVRGEKALNTS
jgi:hypothetical protein